MKICTPWAATLWSSSVQDLPLLAEGLEQLLELLDVGQLLEIHQLGLARQDVAGAVRARLLGLLRQQIESSISRFMDSRVPSQVGQQPGADLGRGPGR